MEFVVLRGTWGTQEFVVSHPFAMKLRMNGARGRLAEEPDWTKRLARLISEVEAAGSYVAKPKTLAELRAGIVEAAD